MSYFADEVDGYFADEHGFRDPVKAAEHAVIVQGGSTTPVREAYRMLKDGPVSAQRATAWLRANGYNPAVTPPEAR
jgi:DhnA family fructose-bisphosphate aldolase class Ia